MWSTTACTCRSTPMPPASSARNCSEAAACVAGRFRRLALRARSLRPARLPARDPGLRRDPRWGLRAHGGAPEELAGGIPPLSAERAFRGYLEGHGVGAIRPARERGRPGAVGPRTVSVRVLRHLPPL